ncbi:hypothetical protein RA264_27765, partial [Pseudomonas syringae pv. tagetis]|uniref:hypothetical protein n=1 Tax=Pseudomonas syringae group genomosp. 7 TaxID=251699 RepID=UPI00376FD542
VVVVLLLFFVCCCFCFVVWCWGLWWGGWLGGGVWCCCWGWWWWGWWLAWWWVWLWGGGLVWFGFWVVLFCVLCFVVCGVGVGWSFLGPGLVALWFACCVWSVGLWCGCVFVCCFGLVLALVVLVWRWVWGVLCVGGVGGRMFGVLVVGLFGVFV